MSTSRKKKTLITTPVTMAEAEEAFAAYSKADHTIDELNAKMDQQITKIRERYADRLSENKEICEEKFEVLSKFAQDNPESFTKRRSMELTYGVIGFRTGTPKLKTLPKFTFAASLELAKRIMPDFIRTKQELNKELLISSRNEKGMEDRMADIGLKVIQDSTFFVEPKKEEVITA